MIYAGIVAGGTGSRMGADRPKQFLSLGGRTVLEMSAAAFLNIKEIDRVYIAVHRDWLEHTRELFKAHGSRVRIAAAGETRSDTLVNLVNAVFAENVITDEDIILTHDAARPFVSERIIRDNIDAARKHTVCTTAIPATDTILVSGNGETVTAAPDRSTLYQAQTPQSFRLTEFRRIYASLSAQEKAALTDACGIFSARGVPVRIVPGEPENFKLTTPLDMKTAEALVTT